MKVERSSQRESNVPALLNQELARAASATKAMEMRACSSLMTTFVLVVQNQKEIETKQMTLNVGNTSAKLIGVRR